MDKSGGHLKPDSTAVKYFIGSEDRLDIGSEDKEMDWIGYREPLQLCFPGFFVF